MKGLLTVAALAILAGSVVAQSQRLPQANQFVEKPGVLEFSGEMIVRPLQFETLRDRGFSALESMSRMQRARARVQRLMVGYIPQTDLITVRIPQGYNENSYSRALMATGDYEYVEPNWICYPVIIPNDPNYGAQWAWPKISAPAAWDIHQGSTNVIVANCDTGVQKTHPDLAASMVPGYNSASGQSEENGGNTNDINGHGTHTAGTMAAIGNNGIGVVGATWRCKIMPIRVTNSSGGGSTMGWLNSGATWAVDNGARAINTSYSGVESSSVQTTGAYIKSRGGHSVWAAGNDGRALSSGADWPDVTIVGASTQSDGRASWSNYGIPIDVFAPGVSILSTYPTSTYAYSDGTSMAAPHATGAYGLLFSLNQSFTPAQLETFLFTTCFDMGTPGNDNTFGWGRINMGAAMQLANQNNNVSFAPSAYRFLAGQYISGVVGDLATGNDQYLRGRGNLLLQAGDPMVLELDMTSPIQTASTMKVNLEMRNSQNMIVTTRLRRWSDSQYVTIDSRSVGTTDTFFQIDVASPNQFIRSGDRFMQAQVRVKLGPSGGMPVFDSFFDVFVIDLTP